MKSRVRAIITCKQWESKKIVDESLHFCVFIMEILICHAKFCANNKNLRILTEKYDVNLEFLCVKCYIFLLKKKALLLCFFYESCGLTIKKQDKTWFVIKNFSWIFEAIKFILFCNISWNQKFLKKLLNFKE